MGLVELFVAVLIAGVSLVNAGVPLAAWLRARDLRFLCLVGANALLALLGALWAWGELPGSPPGYTAVELPVLIIALLATLLLLATSLWRRRV
jgi:hypothetical protein